MALNLGKLSNLCCQWVWMIYGFIDIDKLGYVACTFFELPFYVANFFYFHPWWTRCVMGLDHMKSLWNKNRALNLGKWSNLGCQWVWMIYRFTDIEKVGVCGLHLFRPSILFFKSSMSTHDECDVVWFELCSEVSKYI